MLIGRVGCTFAWPIVTDAVTITVNVPGGVPATGSATFKPPLLPLHAIGREGPSQFRVRPMNGIVLVWSVALMVALLAARKAHARTPRRTLSLIVAEFAGLVLVLAMRTACRRGARRSRRHDNLPLRFGVGFALADMVGVSCGCDDA